MTLHPEEYIQRVAALARQVGAFLKSEQQVFSREKVEEKHSHDYVSYVDKEAEKRLIKGLKEILPEAGFLTEEGLAQYHQEPYFWVIDPLDGTTNYIHGHPVFCVSIALRSASDLLLGVVYDPCLDECFTAVKGRGAFLNGRPMRVSAVDSLDEAFLVTELPYNAVSYARTGEHLYRELYGKVAGLRMTGSAALAICYVAAGRFDGWLEAFIGRWDFSAAALMVLESGGCVTDFYGRRDFVEQHHIIATNGKIHSALQKIVGEALPMGV